MNTTTEYVLDPDDGPQEFLDDFIDEAEAQGCPIRWCPRLPLRLEIHPDGTGTLHFTTWVPWPRRAKQWGTLRARLASKWPPPEKLRARPVPHPDRLAAYMTDNPPVED